jgi:hypothetical protein
VWDGLARGALELDRLIPTPEAQHDMSHAGRDEPPQPLDARRGVAGVEALDPGDDLVGAS